MRVTITRDGEPRETVENVWNIFAHAGNVAIDSMQGSVAYDAPSVIDMFCEILMHRSATPDIAVVLPLKSDEADLLWKLVFVAVVGVNYIEIDAAEHQLIVAIRNRLTDRLRQMGFDPLKPAKNNGKS